MSKDWHHTETLVYQFKVLASFPQSKACRASWESHKSILWMMLSGQQSSKVLCESKAAQLHLPGGIMVAQSVVEIIFVHWPDREQNISSTWPNPRANITILAKLACSAENCNMKKMYFQLKKHWQKIPINYMKKQHMLMKDDKVGTDSFFLLCFVYHSYM